MKTTTLKLVRNALAAAVAVSFAGVAAAHDSSGNNSGQNSGSFSFNWIFGHHSSYGSNQTKGSGTVKEESRNVANFSRLMLALPADVTLVQGPSESLSIAIDDNLLPLMITRVENGELVIEGDKNRGFSTRKAIKIQLMVKSLNGITIKGSGDIVGDQLKTDKFDLNILGSGDVRFKSIRADDFTLAIKGSGDVVIDALDSKRVNAGIHGSGDIKLPAINAASVNLSVRGSGDIEAAGITGKVEVEIMGSGDVDTRKLIAREANVRIQSSGDASVHATEKLVASVSGSGDIRYAGSPASVERSVRGSGTIEPR